MTEPPRQPCCIPGCRRTFKDEGYSEIMCGRHWKMGSLVLRRRRQKISRAYAAHLRRKPSNRNERDLWRMERLLNRLWLRIKAEAMNERPKGLPAFLDDAGLR